MRQIQRAAEPDASVINQLRMVRQAYCDGLWVVLWGMTAKGGSKYWAARRDHRDRDLRAFGKSVHAGIVRECSQSFLPVNAALEVVEEKIRKGYRFIGSFDELYMLGPGDPPDWLWSDWQATDASAQESAAEPVAAHPIEWPSSDVEHAWIW
jgi:hypothetical protein